MLMAVPTGDPRRDDPARLVIGSLMRIALAWAGSAAALCCLAWFAFSPRHLHDLAGAAIGGGLALAFLAAGRSIQVLARGASAVTAWAVFGAQILVLGLAGALVAGPRRPGSWGIGTAPLGSAVAAVALAWTVGVVVAGRRHHQRIYDRDGDR